MLVKRVCFVTNILHMHQPCEGMGYRLSCMCGWALVWFDVFMPDAPVSRRAKTAGLEWLRRLLNSTDGI
jgi:hypothetical protein